MCYNMVVKKGRRKYYKNKIRKMMVPSLGTIIFLEGMYIWFI